MTTPILTSVQVEAIYNQMCNKHRENSDYRMQNYFNCVDDYSWGGICDQAQDKRRVMIQRVLDLVKAQEANGGYIEKIVTELELQNLDGSFVSRNLVSGKYGTCFMWGSEETGLKFCGLAKKQSTFEKKGFRVVSRNYKVKVIFTGRITSKGNADMIVELISMSESVDNTIDISIDNKSYEMYKLRTA